MINEGALNVKTENRNRKMCKRNALKMLSSINAKIKMKRKRKSWGKNRIEILQQNKFKNII
jgi:hypothetical protein